VCSTIGIVLPPQELASTVQTRVRALFPDQEWQKPGVLPAPGSFTLESLQIARYGEGEHFLSHEDAFPRDTAQTNGFQRRATVLMYLNDVAEGGKTSFDWLDVAVQPRKGRAMVFFPAFATSYPDDRTKHAAEDAVDLKWVAQQWCVCGVGARHELRENLRGELSVLNNNKKFPGLQSELMVTGSRAYVQGLTPRVVEESLKAERDARKRKKSTRKPGTRGRGFG
jgi:hypothetical protein